MPTNSSAPKHHHFTLKANGRLRSIETPIRVGPTPLDPDAYNHPINYFLTTGLWDTGATNSCITAEVAKSIGAIPTGKTMVHGAHGPALTNTYLIDFILPNSVRIIQVKATEVVSTVGGFGVIIGMDIIAMGDFCITNPNNKTVVSFRIPSREEIDFGKPQITRIGGSNYTPPKKKRK
jgi:hypothetical protein